MGRQIGIAIAAIAVAAAGHPALAQRMAAGSIPGDAIRNISLTAPEAGLRLSSQFGVRTQASFRDIRLDLAPNPSVDETSRRLRSLGANVDFYPFDNGLRISAGLRIDQRGFYGIAGSGWNSADIAAKGTTMRMLTVGYARDIPGKTRLALDGGIMVRDAVQSSGPLDTRTAIPARPKSGAFPMIRFSLSRAF